MSMSGERILIVDDNPANLRLLAFLLDKKGYEVRTAADASQAEQMMQTWLPRLLLLDLQLPGKGGLELARELRSQAAYHELIIVAVTAFAMKGDHERALEAGCDSYVTKPIDTRGLPVLIQDLLQQARRPDRSPQPPVRPGP